MERGGGHNDDDNDDATTTTAAASAAQRSGARYATESRWTDLRRGFESAESVATVIRTYRYVRFSAAQVKRRGGRRAAHGNRYAATRQAARGGGALNSGNQ